ncbi:hypothetical protein [Streptococcus pluranimalium]|uniref:hypothetical protein n=1 Tax=Streptococcus pluranimalium TaxID=82348 RepID=UPI0039FC0275
MKKTVYFLLSISMFLGLFITNSIKADSLSSNEQAPLFEQVEQANPEGNKTTFTDSGYKTIQITDNNGNIIVAKIENLATGDYITSTSSQGQAIIEKGTLLNGETTISRETFDLVSVSEKLPNESSTFRAAVPSWMYGPWQYTGIAVGKNVFAATVGLPTSALITYVASIFGITPNNVSWMLSYMGAYGISGSALADFLDTNKNGWIGLHYRKVYSSPKVFSGNQHRTY